MIARANGRVGFPLRFARNVSTRHRERDASSAQSTQRIQRQTAPSSFSPPAAHEAQRGPRALLGSRSPPPSSGLRGLGRRNREPTPSTSGGGRRDKRHA